MTSGKTPHILLLHPSCFFYPPWMERAELKTSLVWLASYLSRRFGVSYADFEQQIGRPNSPTQIRRYERHVRRFLLSHEFDILAISCWTSLSYRATLSVARICRDLFPEKLIVVGGYHVTARPNEFDNGSGLFDFVVCGEGELALEHVAERHAREGRPNATRVIRGAAVGEEHFVPYRWDLLADFVREHVPEGIKGPCLYLSRGCPFACSFCMEPTKDRRWRSYTVAAALDEMERLYDFLTPHSIAIADACFGMRPSWRREFLRKLCERGDDYWIVFETRPEYLDERDIAMLADLKVEVQFGLESGSLDMLRLMNKTRHPERYLQQFRHVSRLLTRHRIMHRANVIFNHPGETRQTLDETFAFMDRELEESPSYLIWAPHGYMHFPGCAVDDQREWYQSQFGAEFNSGDWWKDAADQYEASMQVVPSRDLSGDGVRLWESMMNERLERMRTALAPEARAFAARNYFREWLDDTRRQNA
jgi:radical SAM superfamily enzyme YgiQ (UPF0313 family)